ncbi:MAG: hypothetical protein GTO45_11870 [Candidatus Aminicenantes bacterium]|nr:hypothetical protein [Candidatus Aminicenantes bacterium]NIM79505.1 hypothetical protein [Candidatus Aminicenantes bacterium]NIN18789.1 hypothetical protein [Candidatus Aminicenantes bacterium]NIN42711.1 hypothetical protein [Candidatus Aminicenantes bacterium]NIN85445.1 hypothetical protein [Candidatus Aminicenantes bacterium]
MKRLHKSITAILARARLAIENFLKETILQTFLAEYGYDVARVQVGKDKLVQVEELDRQQEVAEGKQIGATNAFNAALKKAKIPLMRYVKIARILFERGSEEYDLLDLRGKRKSKFNEWYEQAVYFYKNALEHPGILAQFALYNITVEKLQAGLLLVEEANTADQLQESLKGEAQDITEARDAALKDLQEWLSPFYTAARISLEDRPQLLEKMGIPVPS